MNADTTRFMSLWEGFIARLDGRLILGMNTQKLSRAIMDITLRDVSACWSTPEHECDRWLSDLGKRAPARAAEITRILTSDMRFDDIPHKRDYIEGIIYATPVAGAAIGLGVATYLGSAALAKTAATLLPAAAGYPLALSFLRSRGKAKADEMKRAYISQLDKYKQSVVSVLES